MAGLMAAGSIAFGDLPILPEDDESDDDDFDVSQGKTLLVLLITSKVLSKLIVFFS